MTNSRLLYTLAIAFSLGLVLPAPAASEPLHLALEKALQRNVALGAAQARLSSLTSAVEVSEAGLRPSESLAISGGYRDSTTNPIGGNNTSNSSRAIGGATFSISQLLFDGGGTRATIAEAQANRQAAMFNAESARQNALLEALRAYSEVVSARRAIEVFAVWQRQQQRLVNDSRNLLEMGQGIRLMEAQAIAELERIRALAAQRQADLVAAEANYRRYIGALSTNPALPAVSHAVARLPESLGEMLQLVKSNNYAIKAAAARLEAAKANFQASSSRGDASARATYSSRYSYQPSPNLTSNLDHQIQVELRVPLDFNGAIDAGTRRASDMMLAAQHDTADAREAQITLAETAWARLNANQALRKSTRARIQASSIAQSSMRESYQAGQSSFSDLLLETRRNREAQLAALEADKALLLSIANVLAATGQLTSNSFTAN